MFLKKCVNIFSLMALLALSSPLTAIAIDRVAPIATAQQKTQSLSWDEVVEIAREQLPQSGVLRVKEDGFIYLDVDDEYIHTLFPLLGLSIEGYVKPPYFRQKNSIGAHISVIYTDEPIIPNEIGESFAFELIKIAIVRPTAAASYVILEVSSPELESLRQSYGLASKLHNHEFHITLAKRRE